MKGQLIAWLSLILIASVVLSGCNSKANNAASSTAPPATKAASAAPSASASAAENVAGTLPIVAEKTTITVMTRGVPQVDSFLYEDNAFTQWLEEQTNIHIEWEVVPNESATQKLNVTLASGKLPDVILGFNISPSVQEIYGKQGLFVPLNAYIDKLGVETKKLFEAMPEAKDLVTMPDGNIYSLPSVQTCFHCTAPYKMYINQKWLDQLNLKMPTTTEEFENVLKAFKTQDPNGNNKADELPLAAIKNNGNIATVNMFETYLMNPFIYHSDNREFVNQDHKIDVIFNKPEWKQGLEYAHRLYTEGLIAPESFTQDRNQMKTQFNREDAATIGAFPAIAPSQIADLAQTRWQDYAAVPPLKGPNGVQYASYSPYQGIASGAALITNHAQDPEIIFRLLDFMFNPEVSLRSLYGVKGQDWDTADAGTIGIDGQPALYKTMNYLSTGAAKSNSWNGVTLAWNPFHDKFATEQGVPNQEFVLYDATVKYLEHKPDMSMITPPLVYDQDQAAELATLEKSILDYVFDSYARFVIGEKDTDKDWDAYVTQLEKMNLARYLEIQQQTYDKKYKK